MKKLLKRVMSSVLISSFALTTVGFAATPTKVHPYEISQIIAFGDSCSDNGAAYATSKDILETPDHYEGAYLKPGELYWENRYSNGKTAVEVLAEMMDKQLVNYATGGATTGYVNYSDWMDSLGYTGILGQIEKYEASLAGREADEEALYFILGGANDYSKFLDYNLPGTVEEVADQVVENISTAVEKLADLGAEKFVVANSINLALVPYEIREGRTEAATTFTNRVNTAMPKVLKALEKELDITIIQYDIEKGMNKLVQNPEHYGLVYLDVECQPTYPEIKPIKPNADQYMFFDEWHFSRVTHRAIGEDLYSTVVK